MIDQEDIKERLKRKSDTYKSCFTMMDVEYLNEGRDFNEFLFTVDVKASTTKTNKFFSDLSFSFLTWRVSEAINEHSHLSFQNDISKDL